MTLIIDFENKTIEVQDTLTIGDIVKKLQELNLDINEFKLKQNYISYPVYPYIPTYPIYPNYPILYGTCQ